MVNLERVVLVKFMDGNSSHNINMAIQNRYVQMEVVCTWAHIMGKRINKRYAVEIYSFIQAGEKKKNNIELL